MVAIAMTLNTAVHYEPLAKRTSSHVNSKTAAELVQTCREHTTLILRSALHCARNITFGLALRNIITLVVELFALCKAQF